MLELVHETIRRAIQTAVRAPVIEKPKPIKQAPSRQLDLWKRPEEMPREPENKPTMDWKHDQLQERLEDFHVEKQVEPVIEPAREPVEEVRGPYDERVSLQYLDERPQFPELEVVGQIHGTYIVAQSSDGFYLIDQHAAQERIKYEFFRDKVGDIDSNERQSLLLPLTFHYSRDEALHLKEHLAALEESGVFLEEFGDTTFIVREYPTWFPKGVEQEVIEDLIEQVLSERKVDIKKLREDAAIMMSCKRSIKANHFLQKHDMERLLADLKLAEQPFTCPHGRPVIIHFKTYDIEKMFKRVMN